MTSFPQPLSMPVHVARDRRAKKEKINGRLKDTPAPASETVPCLCPTGFRSFINGINSQKKRKEKKAELLIDTVDTLRVHSIYIVHLIEPDQGAWWVLVSQSHTQDILTLISNSVRVWLCETI